MFKWLFSGSTNPASMNAGMKNIRNQFCEMLIASHVAFQLAADAYLRKAEPEAVRAELFALDKSINKSERTIRKELAIHTTVHGTADFDQSLIMMSIVKDAERLGDIAKNIYDLAVSAPDVPGGETGEKLEKVKDAILALVSQCCKIFDSQDEVMATELICQAAAIEDACDKQINWFLSEKTENERIDVAYALAFRYFKRYASHVRNIASSIVQPLHKLDFTGKIVKNNPLNKDLFNESSNE